MRRRLPFETGERGLPGAGRAASPVSISTVHVCLVSLPCVLSCCLFWLYVIHTYKNL